MALQKTKEVDTMGVNGDYWRITQINTNFDRADAKTFMSLYVSGEGRVEGKHALGEDVNYKLSAKLLDREIVLDGKEVITLKDLIRREAYAAWKAIAKEEDQKGKNGEPKNEEMAFFADAKDV